MGIAVKRTSETKSVVAPEQIAKFSRDQGFAGSHAGANARHD